MVPRREKATSRAQGKCLAEPSQPEQTEARRKARYDKAFFNSVKDYHRYKQKFAQRKVVPGKIVTIFEPIFPTLVWAFYSRVTYGLEGSVISTVRGVKIRLSQEYLPHSDIPSVGLLMYESKVWPTVLGFEPREAIQRLCGFADAQGMGKPLAHSLIVSNQVLHHMINSILLPRGRHRDESEGIHVEATFSEPMMTESYYTAGPSSQPSFTELLHIEILSQAPHAPDHAPWMDVSAQINSLGLVWRSLL
ncbi:hypothetical protein CK203_012102 [Vitis vinifera]|uniref:Uncharacterized protein n=1 Tax=Vitis vinifera TaxID=29760 RepID=A0A438K0D9_VITVI|nr:hypothetical protein CK203_012102 [Vitis vinifera]